MITKVEKFHVDSRITVFHSKALSAKGRPVYQKRSLCRHIIMLLHKYMYVICTNFFFFIKTRMFVIYFNEKEKDSGQTPQRPFEKRSS